MAVALVVGYHLAPDALPGGFLGVDVFFVLSGFLITSLVLVEVEATGRFDLRAFYLRRFRRLAPALLLMVAALAVYAWVYAGPNELARLRAHSLWTLGYLANWRFVVDGSTYTDLIVGASPLRHAWSLAIEEQFYVLFPLLVLALGSMTRWRPGALRRSVLVSAVIGATASAVWMAVLWGRGAGAARTYFGTDTRAHSLLVGVALGAVVLGRPPTAGRAGRVASWIAPAGLLALLVAVAGGDESAGWLHQGGFMVVALAAAAMIAGLERVGWMRRALSVRPLVALGVISYGVYLWHWPVIVVLTSARTSLEAVPLLALRLTTTLGLALASYVLVERPVRAGELRLRLGRRAPGVALLAMASVVGLVVASTAPIVSPPLVAAAPPEDQRPPGSAAADRFSPSQPAIRVVVLGDSVAHTLAGGVVREFPSFEPWTPEQSPFDARQVELLSLARPGCSFLPGKVGLTAGFPLDLSGLCGDWGTDLDVALQRHEADVLLVALYNDSADRLLGGQVVRLGEAAHDVVLLDFLTEVEALAASHGTSLGLVALPGRVGPDARSGGGDGHRESLVRDLYRSFVAEHPDVVLLDLFGAICAQDDCGQSPPGYDPAWRYDGLHFSADGARWVATWLLPELGAITSRRVP